MIIVTLSSIPSRFDSLDLTLKSLLNQTTLPNKIELYIPESYSRFPDWNGALPNVPDGVDIIRCDHDFGPATKVLPAIKKYKNRNPIVVYCDDDREYPPNWLESFLIAHKVNPDYAICNHGWDVVKKPLKHRPIKVKTIFDIPYRYRRLCQSLQNKLLGKRKPKPERTWRFIKGGYVDIMEGYGGCLIKPSMFDDSIFEIPELAWPHDDIWISGNLARKGVKIWLNPKGKIILGQFHDVEDALNKATFLEMNRDQLTQTLLELMRSRYNIW